MPTITMFEHQRRSYADLGWELDHPAIEGLEQLNEATGTELVRLGRRHLQATQFVGVLRAGEIILQILPKIDYSPVGDAEAAVGSIPHQSAVNSATHNLLYLLSYAHDFPIRRQDITPLLARCSNWFEILTRLLAVDLHHQIKIGMERAYVAQEEELPVMRGRWQLARQLTRHPHVRHRFDVAYDEFSPDTLLNQVFHFTVAHLLMRTQDLGNRRLLSDVHRWMVDVEDLATISQHHLDQVLFTRLNDRFRPSFNLARLFVENQTFQLSTGQHHTFAFVFDMNRLFEAFIYGFLARHRHEVLPARWEDVRLRPQAEGWAIHLAQRLPERSEVFRLKPDILFTRPAGSAVLVLDTKYKQLEAKHRQMNVSRGDVYQMLAYAVALDCPRTLLLYPQPLDMISRTADFETRGYQSRITIAAVNLRQPLDSPIPLIKELSAILEEVAYYDPHFRVRVPIQSV